MRDPHHSELDLRIELPAQVKVYYERDRDTYHIISAWIAFGHEEPVEIPRDTADQIIHSLHLCDNNR